MELCPLLVAIFIIFVLQLIGEALQKYFDLAIPGPVIGLILMLFMLMVTKSKKHHHHLRKLAEVFITAFRSDRCGSNHAPSTS